MATKPLKNTFFNGNKAEIWINGILVFTGHKGSIVKKHKYEEIPAPNGDGTVRVEVGHTIEVNISYRPNGDEDYDAFSSEDISVIMANTNINGEVTKRYKLDGVTFDDETLLQFEKNKLTEIELSGQAETCDKLQ